MEKRSCIIIIAIIICNIAFSQTKFHFAINNELVLDVSIYKKPDSVNQKIIFKNTSDRFIKISLKNNHAFIINEGSDNSYFFQTFVGLVKPLHPPEKSKNRVTFLTTISPGDSIQCFLSYHNILKKESSCVYMLHLDYMILKANQRNYVPTYSKYIKYFKTFYTEFPLLIAEDAEDLLKIPK